LAHATGEWISFGLAGLPNQRNPDPASDGSGPDHALFALVGVAGEDDLDALDLLVDPTPKSEAPVDPIHVSTINRHEFNSLGKPNQKQFWDSGNPSSRCNVR
jgi:hypothetical protein